MIIIHTIFALLALLALALLVMSVVSIFRWLLCFLSALLLISSAHADIGAHQTFEGGSGGSAITKAILDAGNLGSPSGVTWVATNFTDTSSTMLAHTINGFIDTPLLRPVIVNGATNTDIGATRGMRMSTTTTKREYISCFFPATGRVSWGCYITLGAGFNGSTFTSFDLVAVIAGGQFLVCNYQDFPTDFWQAHTSPSGTGFADSGITNTFRPAKDVAYWITGIYDTNSGGYGGANGTSTIWFYDTNTWLRVGTSRLANTATTPATVVNFGNYEPHGVTAPGTVDYDDVAVDYTAAKFPLFPGSKTWVAESASRADVSAAITSASAGDTVIIPSGSNNTWTSTLNITKQIVLSSVGIGSNTTCLTNLSGADTTPMFSLQQSGIVISNLALFGTNHSSANTDLKGYGIETTTNGIEVSHIFAKDLEAAMSFNGRGWIHHCILVNNQRTGRHFGYVAGGTDLWNNDRPLLPTLKSNFMVWENIGWEINSGMANVAAALSIFSAQEAASYVIRYTTGIVSRAVNIAPFLDLHGNDPGIPSLRGSLALQLYRTKTTISGSATFDGKFADLRGAQSNYTAYSVLVYSNQVVGYDVLDDVTVREEDASAPYIDILSGCYVFENYEGASGTTLMPLVVAAGSGSKLTLNSEYFTNAPPVAYANWSFAFPWDSAGAAPGTPFIATAVIGGGTPAKYRGF